MAKPERPREGVALLYKERGERQKHISTVFLCVCMFPTDSEGISRHFEGVIGNLAIHELIFFTFVQLFPLYYLSDA